MKRRSFLISTGLVSAGIGMGVRARAQGGFAYDAPVVIDKGLPVPDGGTIRVAFAINPGTQVIDLAGPWEVFQDVYLRDGETSLGPGAAFELYTVSETTAAIRASGGLTIVPAFSVDNAPDPHVVVIPHFSTEGLTPIHAWIRRMAPKTDLTMSICTGAFQLAKTGLLDGRPATTNQSFYDAFAERFPQVDLLRGPRFVESEGLSTAGGLTAGIDLALRVVQRYFGAGIAQRTADSMEYVGDGWKA